MGLLMGGKDKKTVGNETAKALATAGAGAGLLGVLVWLCGDFWRDMGLEWLRSLLVAVGLALCIRWSFAEPFRIPSGSMEKTLHGDDRILRGDRVFVNKFVYGWRWPLNGTRIPLTNIRIEYAKNRLWKREGPKRWDIVVFKSIEKGAIHTTLVKRVVGLPGERIHIANGKVHANDRPLEPADGVPPVYYTQDGVYGVRTEDEYAVVPDDCYLVLGDNSASSRDGRYFGWLPNERILGRVSCIWMPVSRWRDFTGFSKTWWWRALVAVIGILSFIRILLGRSWAVHAKTPDGRVVVNHLYVNRWAYGVPIPFTRLRLTRGRNPLRGEVVLYRPPKKGKDRPDLLLGRVAGLSDERVFIENGRLLVNGEPVACPPLDTAEYPAVEGVGPYARSKGKEYSATPPDHYFVLTESPLAEEHWDSRTVGWVPHRNLVGRASLVWWPPFRWRRVR